MSGPINLTEVDFDQIKENLISYLKSTKQFTDYDFRGSNLQVILNLIAYQAQLNSYSANMIANESFLASSSIRKNVVANARTIGYVPRSARSATTNIDLSVQLNKDNYPQGFPKTLTILPGRIAIVKNGNIASTFNINQPEVASVTSSGLCEFLDVKIYEGVLLYDTFEVDESKFNQKFLLENKNIDTTSLLVEVQEDPNQNEVVPYIEAKNFVELTSESRTYWIEEIDKEYYELVFGDGYFGRKLKNGAKIFVSYISTNGEMGNGFQNTSNFTFIGKVNDSYNNKVLEKINVDTVGITEGGSSIEEESSIKFRAPREYASQSRCVVSEDYETLVRKVFPSVDAVYVYGGETLPIPEYGRVYVVIKPTAGDKLSNLTKKYIKDSLDPFRVASLDINIIDPLVLNIELNSQVYYDELKTRKDSYAIKSLINESLENFKKSSTTPNFGGSIRYSKLIGSIDDADHSITRNETALTLRRDITVVPNTDATYEICFDQYIKPDKDIASLYSSGFFLELENSRDLKTYYFENDPKTIRYERNIETDFNELVSDIYCFYFNELNQKVRVNFFTKPETELKDLIGRNSSTSVKRLEIQDPGSGFKQADSLFNVSTTTNGTGSGLKVDMLVNSQGNISAVNPSSENLGLNYKVGDIITVESPKDNYKPVTFTVVELNDGTGIVPFGKLYFERGEVLLGYELDNGINFISTSNADNIIEVRSTPNNNDIVAERDVYINLDIAKSNIQVNIDTEVSSS